MTKSPSKCKEFIEWVKNAPVSSGVCMCGQDMEAHTFVGHHPVDMWDYSLEQWLKELADD